MAFNPLQQKMADQGGIPAAAGINVGQAADEIAKLLDDDGRDPDHTDVDNANDHRRGEDRDDQQDSADDQDSGDDQDQDAGGTDDKSEGGDDDAGKAGDDDKADTGDEDGDVISTLEQLAEASEMPLEEFLGALSHTFKAAGGDTTATLTELVEGYQLKADYDRDKTALGESRRTFEAEQQTRVDLYTQHAHVLANQFDLVEGALMQRLQDPRLVRLRDVDQAEYLLQVRDIEGQVNNLRIARQQSTQQYEQFMQQSRQEFMLMEGQKLRDEVTDWDDDKLRVSVDAIKSLGYTDDEVVSVVDSRLIKGALELASLRTENAALKKRLAKGEKAADTVKRTVPKGIKPGKTVRSRRGPDKQSVSKLKRRLGQTHDVKDAAKVIESMMT